MPPLKTRMPDGRIWTIEGPEGASQDEIRQRILQLHPEAGQQSLMGKIASFDVGRDLVTPVLSKGLQVVGQGMAGNIPLSPEEAQANVASRKGAADTMAKMVVPQTPAQALMLAAGPGAGALGGAGSVGSKLPLIGGIMGRKLLGPALSRTAVNTAAGAAGGAVDPNSTVGRGALEGFGASLVGEPLGWLGGKIARSAPGAERAIAGQDMKNIVDEASRAVPELKGMRGLNPAQLMEYVRQNQGGATLSKLMEDTGQAVSRRIRGAPVSVPILGDQPMPLREAWADLARYAQAGYGGYKADPTLRVITGLEPRQVFEQGSQQLGQSLMDLDPTGAATQLFMGNRQRFASGTGYLDALRDAFTKQGKTFFDVPAYQQTIRRDQGELRHLGPGGEVAGGRMASPERTYTGPQGDSVIFTVPGAPPRKPIAALPGAGETGPGRVSAAPREMPAQTPEPPRSATPLPSRFPTPPVERGGPISGGDWSVPGPFPGEPGTMARSPEPSPPPQFHKTVMGPGPMGGPSSSYEPPVTVIMPPQPPSTTVPGRDDFAGMVNKATRGGGLGESDWDLTNWLFPPTGGLGSAIGRFVTHAGGLMPNAGRIYAGQVPRVLPGGAQQGINYEILKYIQELDQPPLPGP